MMILAKDKLFAEGGLSETKVILRWQFNFRFGTLTISFPDHKFIAWRAAIQKTITLKCTTSNHGTNGTRGFLCDSLGLPFPQSTPFHSLPQHNSMLRHNQQHVYQIFEFNEWDSGKIKQGNWYELTCILISRSHILLRFVPVRAQMIQQSRAHMGAFRSQFIYNFKWPRTYSNISRP